jgi:hypothetical protein
MMAAPFILTLALAAAPQTVTPVSPAPAAPLNAAGSAGGSTGGSTSGSASRVDAAQPTVRRSTGPVRHVGGDAEAGPLRDELETVDAGTEDVGPLGTSLRQTAYDPRLPAGFSRVYRVPGDARKFMRGNGALFAIFPASVYRRTSRGGVPVTPPGTVYRIGMPGDLHLAPEAHAERELAPLQRDTRIDGRIEPTQVAETALVQSRIDARAPQTTAAIVARTGRAGPQRVPAAESREEQAADLREAPVESSGAAADPYAHLAFGAPRVERE